MQLTNSPSWKWTWSGPPRGGLNLVYYGRKDINWSALVKSVPTHLVSSVQSRRESWTAWKKSPRETLTSIPNGYTPPTPITLILSTSQGWNLQFSRLWDNYGNIGMKKWIMPRRMTQLLTKRKTEMSIFMLRTLVISLRPSMGWSTNLKNNLISLV